MCFKFVAARGYDSLFNVYLALIIPCHFSGRGP